MNSLLQQIEAAVSLDEQWALAASFEEDGGPAIPGGARWVFGVGDNWDHYQPDPLEEFLGENADDNGSIALVTVQERETRYGSVMPAAVVMTGIEQIRTVDAAHIVRNDPARVLRRVARDRKLLARHQPDSYVGIRCCSYCRADHTMLGEHDNTAQLVRWPCDDVRDLAEDYEIEVEG